MKTKKFFDANMAERYLINSVIRVNGRPVFIHDVSGRMAKLKLSFHHLGDSESNSFAFLDAGTVDMNPVPLGLMNRMSAKNDMISNGCVWVARHPYRQWKIGLDVRNVKMEKMRTGKPSGYSGMGYSSMLDTKDLRNTILGDYPDVDKAKIISKTSGKPVAFSRHFCIEGYRLYYKASDKEIGQYVAGTVRLKDEFFYFKEALQEVVS